MSVVALYGNGKAIKHPFWKCAHNAKRGIEYQATIDNLIQQKINSGWDVFDLRRKVVSNSSWFIADNATLDHVADFLRGKKVLEIGAGTGYFALQMRYRGVTDYRAIDSRESYYDLNAINYGVEVLSFYALSLEEIAKYDVIVITWPPYDTKLAYNIAMAMRKGQMLVYQGERWGCTGCDKYHGYLEKYFLQVNSIFDSEHETPTWGIVKDRWYTLIKESSHRYWNKSEKSNSLVTKE